MGGGGYKGLNGSNTAVDACLYPQSNSVFLYTYTNKNYYKFTVVYCESVNLIGYVIVCYLMIVNSYASVHIARHV